MVSLVARGSKNECFVIISKRERNVCCDGATAPHRCYYKIVREEKIQDFPENPPKTDQISQSYEMMHTF